jgi:hypothetical protein
MRSLFAVPAILGALVLTGTLASAQTNPGGGTRATGYPTEKSAGPSDPLIEKPTSGQIKRGGSRRTGTTGLSATPRSGPKAPATGAPTGSQLSPGDNGG